MGGTTSKFEDNDWHQASGGLQSNAETIDFSPPTPNYGVYWLMKRNLWNQREFDVVDDQHNLLYTTNSVPKTLACFDVLGPAHKNDYLLRVSPDISRRYWMVYRYHQPSFPGQVPDTAASQLLAEESTCQHSETPPPLLYRKCCIVVSWSRYVAISVMLGPPPPPPSTPPPEVAAITSMRLEKQPEPCVSDDEKKEDVTEGVPVKHSRSHDDKKEKDDDHDDDDDDVDSFLFRQATQIASRMKDRVVASTTSCLDGDELEGNGTTAEVDRMPSTSSSTITHEQSAMVSSSCTARTKETSDEDVLVTSKNDHLPRIASSHQHDDNDSSDNHNDEVPVKALTKSESLDSLSSFSSSIAFPQWLVSQSQSLRDQSRTLLEQSQSVLQQQTQVIKDTSSHYLKTAQSSVSSSALDEIILSDPQQGVLNLDNGPMLQCQEIYNRIIGNHQTSLVDKQTVLELLQKDTSADPHLDDQQQQRHSSSSTKDEGRENVDDCQDDGDHRRRRTDQNHVQPIMDPPQTQPESETARESSSLHTVNNEVIPTNEQDDCDTSKPHPSDPVKPPDSEQLSAKQLQPQPQPLVGYWAWENTLRTHQMKMHVAKDADLALHVVMAILVNQVRYERNAIAMTV